jgi:glycosyltransferase involved in cell wall biosynthesis
MKILFISHDANRAGAQIFCLNIMQYLHKKGIAMHLLLLDGGVLEKDFSEICEVSVYPKTDLGKNHGIKKVFSKLIGSQKNDNQKEAFFANLSAQNFDLIYANTIATAWVMPELLAHIKVPLLTHIHELEFSIQLYSTTQNREFMFENTTKLIACSNAVAQNIIEKHNFSADKIETIHSFVDNENVISRSQNTDKQAIKQKYKLPKDAFLIGGCGNAEWRKGIDIFASVASRIKELSSDDFHFVWIGVKKSGEYYEQICYDIEKLGIEQYITFIEQTPDAIELINCLDIFTLPSREDPFPLVMLEAALAKRTIVGFEKTGGCSEFVETDAGVLVSYTNTNAMAIKILDLYKNQNLAAQLGENAHEKVLKKYSIENSVVKIERLLRSVPKV